jgi:WD40 repeat protein
LEVAEEQQEIFDDESNTRISRMQGEREQTNAKIDAIRTVVSNYESSKLQSPAAKKDIQKTHSLLKDENNQNESFHSSSLASPSPTNKRPIQKALSEKRIKPIPQVTLDPSSIDYISKLINDKISRDLAARDKRILDQVHDLVQESLQHMKVDDQTPPSQQNHHHHHNQQPSQSKFVPVPPSDDTTPKSEHSGKHHQNSRIPSGVQYPQNQSKIPRIKLPKVGAGDKKVLPSPRMKSGGGGFETPLSADGRSNSLLNLPPIKSRASLSMNKQLKDEYISVEGIQYSQCRSVVYPSTTDIDLLKTRHLRKIPKLNLRHIFGYDGDPSRHGGGLKGKNVLWLNATEIAFPAAAVVVVMDVMTEKQKFFLNHTDDVISLATYPLLNLIASCQTGNDCSILIWNYKDLSQSSENNNNSANMIQQQLLPPTNLRGMNNLCFSPDGRLLLACGIEDSKIIYIFDWQKNQLLASAKTGHSDYCQFAFNPFCFESFEDENHYLSQRASMKKGSLNSNLDGNVAPLYGCYAITSMSGKILKFWTIKQQFNIPAKQQEVARKPSKQQQQFQYLLEGSQGQLKKFAANKTVDFTAYTFIGHDSFVNYLLIGLSNGSIQVWHHSNEMIDGHHLSWSPKGKLLLVIADVHDYPITEMDYSIQESKLITGDSQGILNVWNVHVTEKIMNGLPLEHLGGIALDTTSARSLQWNHFDGSAIAIGATNNSISVLRLNDNNNADNNNKAEGMVEFDLQALLIAHNGKVRHISVHPLQDNFFATICSDNSIRVWDSDLQCHISCIFIESQPTAISFSADGAQLTVGNEKGELIVLSSREFQRLLSKSPKHNSPSNMENINFEWKVLETKVFSSSSKGSTSVCFQLIIIFFLSHRCQQKSTKQENRNH